MNNYLVESLDSLESKNIRDRIIKDNDFLDADISIYDLEENTLDNALEDLDTYGFLSNKKVIIITNIELLKYDDCKDKIEHLLKYIKNPNKDNLLIIECRNTTNKIIKELKKVLEFVDTKINSKDYIKNTFKDYKIDNRTISMLDEYCLGDFTKLVNECDKLKNYKYDDKIITTDDIEELVMKKLGDSRDLTFAFSRSIATRDIKDALVKYNELLKYNIEPLSIIGLLASQLRIIYQVKLLEKNNNDKEIAGILGEKSDYRIKKTRELTRLYSENDLLRLMQELANMDYRIKTEDVDGNSLIEMFILNI
ncbi:MAG: DNA polymerase III subunit delta [Bacilli bacterium]|nr:DNA polymerase III subunit delta [Bacilli bacterium]